MSPSTDNRAAAPCGAATNLKTLYIAGGVAPLVTLVFYLSELLLIPWDHYPATIEDWFALFQRSKVQGLFVLNALDIIWIALLGVMFLALFMALRQAELGSMIIALFFGLLGVGVFIVPRGAARRDALPLTPKRSLYHSSQRNGACPPLGSRRDTGQPGHAHAADCGFPVHGCSRADHLTGYAARPAVQQGHGLFWLPWWVLIGFALLRMARN